jgi:hypothetical protein
LLECKSMAPKSFIFVSSFEKVLGLALTTNRTASRRSLLDDYQTLLSRQSSKRKRASTVTRLGNDIGLRLLQKSDDPQQGIEQLTKRSLNPSSNDNRRSHSLVFTRRRRGKRMRHATALKHRQDFHCIEEWKA